MAECTFSKGTNRRCLVCGRIGCDATRGQLLDAAVLRAEFVRLLTEDGPTRDKRRKDWNQAIFLPDGPAVFNGTDLAMVLQTFDKAVKAVAT